jgi:hypothetical protein
MDRGKFEVTVAFKNEDTVNLRKAIEIAKNNAEYSEIKKGRITKNIASFDKSAVKEFFEFYNLVADSIIYILINGKKRPFTRELWLPLLRLYL